MLKIGDFSRIARVSTRLLRWYDEVGLLKPARIEAETGYRWYHVGQLRVLNRILVLKELGLSLDVEMGYLLKAPHKGAPPAGLTIRELPAVQTMATCVRVGLPEDAHLVTAKIGRFLETGGDRLAGPGREMFLQPPDLERMHEAVVEMQFPIVRNDALPWASAHASHRGSPRPKR